MYDYVIIGAGPVGLTLAWYLTQLDQTKQKKICLLDREAAIGGCHRVRRTDKGYFTEHGPRIYSQAYVNFIRLLSELGGDFEQMFTPYLFNMTTIGGEGIWDMHWYEILLLGWAYIQFFFFPRYGLKQSVANFGQGWGFSQETLDYLDRVCRLTDGAGADRYTMYEFLQLLNQNALYSIMQPRLPNDEGLFPLWQQKLMETGRIDLRLNHEVVGLLEDGSGQRVTGLECITREGQRSQILGHQVILACPPEAIQTILKQSAGQIPKTFGSNFSEFELASRYITYIPITFHWYQKLSLPKQWGFGKNDWGLVYVEMTDYMNFQEPGSQTVISACLTRLDQVSRRTGKTAHQSSQMELLAEAFQELNDSYPGTTLPQPNRMILSPGVYRSRNEYVWKTRDSAFILTATGGFWSPFKAQGHQNLWQVGAQNGRSKYEFTSMEAAVTNALAVLPKLIEKGERTVDFSGRIRIRSGWTVLGIFRIILLALVVWLSLRNI